MALIDLLTLDEPKTCTVLAQIMKLQDRLLEKEMLKRKFRKILDLYITHREALG